MVYKFFLFFVLFCISSFSSLKEGVNAFNEGNYKKSRLVLGEDNFKENISAQLYFLASQGFDFRDRDEHLVVGLKSLVQKALANDRHELYIPAKLVHIFWNLYSENTRQDSTLGMGDMILTAPEEVERPVVGRRPSRSLREDAALLEDVPLPHDQGHRISQDVHIPIDLPPLGASFEQPDLDEIESHIHRGQYFPIPNLFEGEPSECIGIAELSELVKQRNAHALFSMGTYFFAQDKGCHKSAGLGCLVSAAHLGNATAHNLVKNLIGIKQKKGWSENCALWCCSGGPSCRDRLTCGGDVRGDWWLCNLGFFGFKTRWSLGRLCFNMRKISRTSLENLAMLAGMSLMLVQQLETAGLIDIFDDDQAVIGWIGLLAAGGGFGAARVNA